MWIKNLKLVSIWSLGLAIVMSVVYLVVSQISTDPTVMDVLGGIMGSLYALAVLCFLSLGVIYAFNRRASCEM